MMGSNVSRFSWQDIKWDFKISKIGLAHQDEDFNLGFRKFGQNSSPTTIAKLIEEILSAFTEYSQTHAHTPLFISCHQLASFILPHRRSLLLFGMPNSKLLWEWSSKGLTYASWRDALPYAYWGIFPQKGTTQDIGFFLGTCQQLLMAIRSG